MLQRWLNSDAQPGLNAQYHLNAEPGLDLSSKPYVLVHSFKAYQDAELLLQVTCYKPVHLYTTYTLKLHLFQRCRVTSKSYMLQTRPLHPYGTYAITLHIWVHFLRSFKMQNYLCKLSLDQKIYRCKWVKDSGSTISRLLLSLFASLFTFFLFSLFCSKTKKHIKEPKANHQTSSKPPFSFSLTLFHQNLGIAPWKTLSRGTLQMSPFCSRLSNTNEPK